MCDNAMATNFCWHVKWLPVFLSAPSNLLYMSKSSMLKFLVKIWSLEILENGLLEILGFGVNSLISKKNSDVSKLKNMNFVTKYSDDVENMFHNLIIVHDFAFIVIYLLNSID